MRTPKMLICLRQFSVLCLRGRGMSAGPFREENLRDSELVAIVAQVIR